MMNNDIVASLNQSEPPSSLSLPLQALWWLRKGDYRLGKEWERAHGICQIAEGSKGHDWVHALAHWIEGDEWNADYWYKRAGEARSSDDSREEWAHIAGKLSG